MASDDLVRTKIDQILDSVAAKEKKLWRLAFALGIASFGSIFFLVFLHSRGASHEWADWIGLLSLSVFPAFVLGATVFWVGILPEEKRARRSYIAGFSSKEERLFADSILTQIPARKRNLVTLSRFRRKLGVVTRRFRCHDCGARLKIKQLGQVVQCRRCKVQLTVPRDPCCPWCAKRNVRIVTPEEQVSPIRSGQATTAGGLVYGPAGLLAGGILDAIYRPFKEAFREAVVLTKAHVFYCTSCHHKWATTLHPHAMQAMRTPPEIRVSELKQN